MTSLLRNFFLLSAFAFLCTGCGSEIRLFVTANWLFSADNGPGSDAVRVSAFAGEEDENTGQTIEIATCAITRNGDNSGTIRFRVKVDSQDLLIKTTAFGTDGRAVNASTQLEFSDNANDWEGLIGPSISLMGSPRVPCELSSVNASSTTGANVVSVRFTCDDLQGETSQLRDATNATASGPAEIDFTDCEGFQ